MSGRTSPASAACSTRNRASPDPIAPRAAGQEAKRQTAAASGLNISVPKSVRGMAFCCTSHYIIQRDQETGCRSGRSTRGAAPGLAFLPWEAACRVSGLPGLPSRRADPCDGEAGVAETRYDERAGSVMKATAQSKSGRTAKDTAKKPASKSVAKPPAKTARPTAKTSSKAASKPAAKPKPAAAPAAAAPAVAAPVAAAPMAALDYAALAALGIYEDDDCPITTLVAAPTPAAPAPAISSM